MAKEEAIVIERKTLQLWECKRCGKVIPYKENYCHECANQMIEHMEEIHRR